MSAQSEAPRFPFPPLPCALRSRSGNAGTDGEMPGQQGQAPDAMIDTMLAGPLPADLSKSFDIYSTSSYRLDAGSFEWFPF